MRCRKRDVRRGAGTGNVGPMDIVTLAQVVTSVTNLLFVIVLAAGYYFTWQVSQTTLQEMRAAHGDGPSARDRRGGLREPARAGRGDPQRQRGRGQGHRVPVLGAHRELQRLRHLGPTLLQIRSRLPAAAG